MSRVGIRVTNIAGSRSDDWIYCHVGYNLSLNYNFYSAIADLHILQFTFTYALGFSVFTSHLLVKVKLSLYRTWMPLGSLDVETPTFSDIRLTDGGNVVSPKR
jgi:hypothetical protein